MCRELTSVMRPSPEISAKKPASLQFRKSSARARSLGSAATTLPLAVGFGVRTTGDLNALTGKAEVAAFCSQYIEWQRDDGSDVAADKMAAIVRSIQPA